MRHSYWQYRREVVHRFRVARRDGHGYLFSIIRAIEGIYRRFHTNQLIRHAR